MKKLTGSEIIAKLLEKNSFEDIAYCDFDNEELGEYEEVKQSGGEDEGSNWYSVIYFKDHDVYIKSQGYYQSHYGTDFDYPPFEVKPKEKTITVYE